MWEWANHWLCSSYKVLKTDRLLYTAVVYPVMDLADMLPWMCSNTSGSALEAQKPAFLSDTSYWHSTGARQKASTPASTWSDIVLHKSRSSKTSNKRTPALTPLPELSLQNKYDTLALNDERCDNTTKLITLLSSKADQNQKNAPKPSPGPGAE